MILSALRGADTLVLWRPAGVHCVPLILIADVSVLSISQLA